ncbi:MAG: Unknown protein [uncultured Sulfurovum sp.]|uniref:Uncharacterized protein n=1 Tax=uncultured Sulfurovum sp. TaxID=269237 RepID=A0A6S6SDD8_9BACT|nr:MAG: Unknown protein [uncultured Sulfurovum sp.]
MIRHIQYLILIFVLLFLVSCNGSKQAVKEEVQENNITTSPIEIENQSQPTIKNMLDSYLNKLATFDTDAIVDMTYPKLFYVIDPELYRQYIASMMNSSDIIMTSYETNVTKFSPVLRFSNETEFAQVNYTSKVNIQFLNNNLYDTEEKINFLYDALIHKYGQENINIDVKKRTLAIKKAEKLIIIKEKDTEWKFLGDNSKYRQLYPNFLPREILNNLDKEITVETQKSQKLERRDTNETI